jgi:hypothetical protein
MSLQLIDEQPIEMNIDDVKFQIRPFDNGARLKFLSEIQATKPKDVDIEDLKTIKDGDAVPVFVGSAFNRMIDVVGEHIIMFHDYPKRSPIEVLKKIKNMDMQSKIVSAVIEAATIDDNTSKNSESSSPT